MWKTFALYAAIILAGFFVYLLFTQPQNAMYYLERIVTVIAKIFYGIVLVLYKIVEGIVNFFINLFRRK
jgi:cell shape-determining protein MreC